MAVNKNFVIKNGLEVDSNLIFADATTRRVGIASTVPNYTLNVAGGIGATDLYISGVSTFVGALDINDNVVIDGNVDLNGNFDVDFDGTNYQKGFRVIDNSGVTLVDINGTGTDVTAFGIYDGSSSTYTTQITHSGIATFASTIVSGADPNVSTSNVGQRMDPTSGIVARSAGSNHLWTGYATGSGTVTSEIKANGVGIFSGSGQFGTEIRMIRADGKRVNLGGSDTHAVHEQNGNFVLKYDGSATFTARSQIGTGTLSDVALALYNDTTTASEPTLYIQNDQSGGNLLQGFGGGSEKVLITAAGAATFAGGKFVVESTGQFVWEPGTISGTAYGKISSSYGGNGSVLYGKKNDNSTDAWRLEGTGAAQFAAGEMTINSGGYINKVRGVDVESVGTYSDAETKNIVSRKSDGTESASITAAGLATFAGTIQSGGNPNSGTAAGTSINEYGTVRACQTSGSSTIFEGYTKDTATATSSITAAGAATFAGNVTATSYYGDGSTLTNAGTSLGMVIALSG